MKLFVSQTKPFSHSRCYQQSDPDTLRCQTVIPLHMRLRVKRTMKRIIQTCINSLLTEIVNTLVSLGVTPGSIYHTYVLLGSNHSYVAVGLSCCYNETAHSGLACDSHLHVVARAGNQKRCKQNFCVVVCYMEMSLTSLTELLHT